MDCWFKLGYRLSLWFLSLYDGQMWKVMIVVNDLKVRRTRDETFGK